MNALHMNLNSMNISSSVCQPFPLSARSSIHRPLCLSFPLCVRPLIRPSGFLSIRTSVRLFVRLSVQYSVGLWVRPSVFLSIRPSVTPSVCGFVRPFYDHKLSFPCRELSAQKKRENGVAFLSQE